jgi:hypothetical protein
MGAVNPFMSGSRLNSKGATSLFQQGPVTYPNDGKGPAPRDRVVDQFDCGRGTGVEPSGRRRIFEAMDQLEKCMQSLRVLIASGDDGAIILAEKAVNDYLAAFPVKQHAGALHLLQDTITPLWRGSSGIQTEFINMVLDYTDNRILALQEPQ